MIQTNNDRLFYKLGIVTISAVYFLILVGGIVRSTGSGMGCPDWPKCFGNWIPPTDVSQLPEDYKEIYSEKRIEKNQKIARYMEVLGFSGLANQIRHEESVLAETEFNNVKTWIEYLNRLVGVVIGILIIATLAVSIRYIGRETSIFVLSLLAFILVIFQGWIGSLVVSTNLLPWMVTVHMLLALLLIAILILAVYKARPQNIFGVKTKKWKLNLVLILCTLSILIQTVIGTQVREMIDVIALSFNYLDRYSWIENLGMAFYIHRSFSIAILILHLFLIYILYNNSYKENYLLNLSIILSALVIFEVLTGVVMAYFGIPAFAQPVHLLLATIIFGIQFYLILLVNYNSDRKFADVSSLKKAEF